MPYPNHDRMRDTFAHMRFGNIFFAGGAAGAQLQSVLSSPAVTAALQLPVDIATSVLQTQIDNALRVVSRNLYLRPTTKCSPQRIPLRR